MRHERTQYMNSGFDVMMSCFADVVAAIQNDLKA
jgi:hypothetical protein